MERGKKRANTKVHFREFFCCSLRPFHPLHVEKASKGFFPPLSFSSLCKYEYGKECQDVLEEAVYITQVEDYFLEVHFLMTACGVVCVFCIRRGQDRWCGLRLCCRNLQRNVDDSHRRSDGGHFTVSAALRLCFFPSCFLQGYHCLLGSTNKKSSDVCR